MPTTTPTTNIDINRVDAELAYIGQPTISNQGSPLTITETPRWAYDWARNHKLYDSGIILTSVNAAGLAALTLAAPDTVREALIEGRLLGRNRQIHLLGITFTGGKENES